MPLDLFRIDERLLHGQVIVGWGMRLHLDYYVIVDDDVASNEWESNLYAAGLPAGVDADFVSVQDAVARFDEFDARPGRVEHDALEVFNLDNRLVEVGLEPDIIKQ